MRRDMGWTTLEYCWRFGVRPMMWVVRLAVVAWGIGSLSWLLTYGHELGVIAGLLAYGIWEIGRSIRLVQPLNIHVTRGEKLIVQRGASVSVPKQDIDRLIEIIGRQEAAKIEQAEEGKAG